MSNDDDARNFVRELFGTTTDKPEPGPVFDQFTRQSHGLLSTFDRTPGD